MKKPLNYYGFAWSDPADGYSEEYKNSKEGKKEIKKIKKRHKEYRKFYEKHGFDPTECWNLDETIARFILPRLRYYRNHHLGYPNDLTPKKWKKILDKMIEAFELSLEDEFVLDENKYKKIKTGLKLFSEYFLNLWD